MLMIIVAEPNQIQIKEIQELYPWPYSEKISRKNTILLNNDNFKKTLNFFVKIPLPRVCEIMIMPTNQIIKTVYIDTAKETCIKMIRRSLVIVNMIQVVQVRLQVNHSQHLNQNQESKFRCI